MTNKSDMLIWDSHLIVIKTDCQVTQYHTMTINIDNRNNTISFFMAIKPDILMKNCHLTVNKI